MKTSIVGLAGHVDHGKTSLIRALNGFDGDQTSEEKRRGLTMDLSFTLMDEEEKRIFLVDVPGHEKFVKHYLAGVFGFDVLLLIVAANEGICKQSIEHLELAHLAGVKSVILVLTKCDLVEPHVAAIVKKDILNLIENIGLESLFSAHVGRHDPSSYEQLKHKLFTYDLPQRPQEPYFRYYIDRSFSKDGYGTIVTGTVLGGSLKTKDKITIPRLKTSAIVRTIHSGLHHVPTALPNERIALNLSGVKSHDLKRGDILCTPNFLRGFMQIDVMITPLKGVSLKHQSEATLYIGSARHNVILKIISEHDSYAIAIFESTTPIYALYREKFILRDAQGTLGGGEVLNPIADPMKRKQKNEFLLLLQQKKLSEAFAMLMEIHKKGFGLIGAYQRFGMDHASALELAMGVANSYLDHDEKVLYPSSTLEMLKEYVRAIYRKNRRALLSKNSLHLRFTWASANLCQEVLTQLESNDELIFSEGLYRSIHCDIEDMPQYLEESLYGILETQGWTPQAPYVIYESLDLDRIHGDETMKRLCSAGKVIRLAHNLFISAPHLSRTMQYLRGVISEYGYVDIELAKAQTALSRKYLIAYLEYLDRFEDIQCEGTRRSLKAA